MSGAEIENGKPIDPYWYLNGCIYSGDIVEILRESTFTFKILTNTKVESLKIYAFTYVEKKYLFGFAQPYSCKA